MRDLVYLFQLLRDFLAKNKDFKQEVNAQILARIPTGFLRKLPDFFLIGLEKCGTSTFFSYLKESPQIHPPIRRGPHFFNPKNSIYYEKQLSLYWYRCWFPTFAKLKLLELIEGRRQLCVDGSPSYFYRPGSPRKISQNIPDPKLIVLLRNPVYRAYSDFHFRGKRMLARKTGVPEKELTFRHGLRTELDLLPAPESIESVHDLHDSENLPEWIRCFRLGLYYFYFKHWLKYFDRDQILLIKSENFFNSPFKILSRTASFLEIDDFRNSINTRHKRKTSYPPMKKSTARYLNELYKPFNQKFYELADRNMNWEAEV